MVLKDFLLFFVAVYTATFFFLLLTLDVLACDMKNAGSDRINELQPSVAGLILARCGSKGIPKKNLAQVGGESLIKRTVKTMQTSGKFSSIWVATDCNVVAEEALLSGAQVFRRSAESATDTAPSILAVKEFLSHNSDIEYVGLFQCTSPFLSSPFIHSAFSLLNQGYDSVFSVNRIYKLRWQIYPDGNAKAQNFHPAYRPRRQDWDGELIENGMFYFMSRHLVFAGLLQGGRIGVVEVPTNCSMEIDTQADLDVAVALVESRRRRRGPLGLASSASNRYHSYHRSSRC